MLNLAVIILTYNEELHIARAIRSIQNIAQDIVVIDSQSMDRTVDIASGLGARVFQHAFVNQARQFGWAMTHCDVTAEWTMRLDADEYVEPDLATNLAAQLPSLPPSVTGINLKRKQIFMDRWIRYGDRYPLVMLRVWRTGMAEIEDRWMDEHLFVTSGATVTLDGGFADHNLNPLAWFIDKHNKYATREAIEIITQRHSLNDGCSAVAIGNSSTQVGAKRFLKQSFYEKLPFPIAATLYFLYRYVIRFGFLDGIEGAIYHFLQGYWYRFLVGARVFELSREIARVPAETDLAAKLTELTGLPISSN
jgi:glycosyltransferase involved in cell wall biosynthesis